MEPWVPVFYEPSSFGASEWINLFSGLGGAILGATIGAIVSWRLQIQATKAAVSRDENVRRATDQAQLFGALVRLTYVIADVNATDAFFQEAVTSADGQGLSHVPLGAKVTYISGVGIPQPIVADEIAPLAAAKHGKLIAEYGEVLMQHAVMISNIKEFNGRQKFLMENVDIRYAGDGRAKVTSDDLERHRVKYVQVSQLAENIISDAKAISKKGEKVLKEFRRTTKNIYPDFPLL